MFPESARYQLFVQDITAGAASRPMVSRCSRGCCVATCCSGLLDLAGSGYPDVFVGKPIPLASTAKGSTEPRSGKMIY